MGADWPMDAETCLNSIANSLDAIVTQLERIGVHLETSSNKRWDETTNKVEYEFPED